MNRCPLCVYVYVIIEYTGGIYVRGDQLAREIVESLRGRIRRYLADGRRGEILRSGVRLAIFGPPNAGKSSLLNYLGT